MVRRSWALLLVATCVAASCDSARVVCRAGQVRLASGECADVLDGAAPPIDAEPADVAVAEDATEPADGPADDARPPVADAIVPDAPGREVGPACDEGAACGADWCVPGVCSATGSCEDEAPRDCDDGLECTLDSCDGAARACSHEGSICTCRLGGEATPMRFVEPVTLALVARTGGWGVAWANGISSSSRRARAALLAPDGSHLHDVDLGAASGGVAVASDGAELVAAVAHSTGVLLHRISAMGVMDPMPATIVSGVAQGVAMARRSDGFDVGALARDEVRAIATLDDGSVVHDVVVGAAGMGNRPTIQLARGDGLVAIAWVSQRELSEWPTVSVAIAGDDGSVVHMGAKLSASDPELAIADGASVSFDGSAFVVTWVEDVILGYDADDQPIDGGARLLLQRVGLDGAELGAAVTLERTSDPDVFYEGPSAVWTGRDHRVAWEARDVSRFVRVSADGTVLGSPITLAADAERASVPTVGGSDGSWALVMVRDRTSIWFRELSCP